MHADHWPITTVSDYSGFCRAVDDVMNADRVVWRGAADFLWHLRSSLDRRLHETYIGESYEQWLSREIGLYERFSSEAWPYATEMERRFLMDTTSWTKLAFARHAGLPTRLLDWTHSPWVAAYFACHEHSAKDGSIWWFDRASLADVLTPRWSDWGVGRDLNTGEAETWLHAFRAECVPWLTCMYYPIPCSRMEAQQGLMTVCGRLRFDHSDAIDSLPDHQCIRRGRIVIPARLKGSMLADLRTKNIHARSLEYPGVDIVAQRIGP